MKASIPQLVAVRLTFDCDTHFPTGISCLPGLVNCLCSEVQQLNEITMEACGPEGSCSRRLYPSSVVQSVRKEAKSLLTLDPDVPISVDASLELDAQLRNANFRDAAVRFEESVEAFVYVPRVSHRSLCRWMADDRIGNR